MAFTGTVGSESGCAIYDNRPGCCRDFKASFEDGLASARCDEARVAKGLRVLAHGDWSVNSGKKKNADSYLGQISLNLTG